LPKDRNEGPRQSSQMRSNSGKILVIAARGNLEVHVLRTEHTLRVPKAPVVEDVATTTDEAARLARTALDDLARLSVTAADDVLRGVTEVAEGTATSADDAARAAEHLKLGRAADAGFRAIDADAVGRRFADGQITQQQREMAHAKNGAGSVGGWGGAVAGAQGGAAVGGAVGGPIGAGVGAVVGGVAGYFGGEAAATAAVGWTLGKLHNAGMTVRGGWNRVLGY
jgi:hypothetical protein